ncbi:MAG: DeoR/GlpR family DNA-binding transcription regulator [Opitutaceae bacterium]|nr:DeoR/GlpR family DNA-binding transcription regulator [Opitutaceae bacterium]
MKVPLHVVRARQARLAALLQQNQYLPLQTLCATLGVSAATARRDLATLARARVITRTRGGALTDFNQRFPSFRERQFQAHAAKRRLAARARQALQPGMAVFFDAGTTVYAIAEALAARPVPRLTAVTNSLPVAELLARVDGMEVNLVGGQYLVRQSVLFGDAARRGLRLWKFDCAFLGAEGMTAAGLWNSQRDVVLFQRTAAQRARRAVFCLDRSKLGLTAPEFLLPWVKVDRLLTDATAVELCAADIRLQQSQLLAAG